jgi:hypothetical protein
MPIAILERSEVVLVQNRFLATQCPTSFPYVGSQKLHLLRIYVNICYMSLPGEHGQSLPSRRRDPGDQGTSLLPIVNFDPAIVKENIVSDPSLTEMSIQMFFGAVARRFENGPFNLAGTNTDGVSGLLVAVHAALHRNSQYADTAARAEQARLPIPISLELAKSKPELIISMVKDAEITASHELVLAADTKTFDEAFAGYTADGEDGFWNSMKHLQYRELFALGRRRIGTRKATKDHRANLHDFRYPKIAVFTDQFKPPLGSDVRSYIEDLDKVVLDSHVGRNEPVQGAENTRERLERWAAVNLDYLLHDIENATGPTDSGNKALASLLNLEQETDGGAPEPKVVGLKLLGLRRVLQTERAEYHRLVSLAGEPIPVPKSLSTLEALNAALTAKILLLETPHLEEQVFFNLVTTIAGMDVMEEQGQASDQTAQGHSPDVLNIDSGSYSQADFARDIGLASTTHKLIGKFGDSRTLAEFEAKAQAWLSAKLAAGSATSTHIGADILDTTMTPELRRLLDTEHYKVLGDDALRGAVESGNPIQLAVAQAAFSDVAAHETDGAGRYEEVRTRAKLDAGEAQRREDFSGVGRLFNYYGSLDGPYREHDGSPGGIEAVTITTESFRHIDIAGVSPMRDSVVRGRLEATAAQSGESVEVHRLDEVPPDYECEMANYFGLMPRGLSAEDMLRPIIPNGVATASYEPNQRSGLIDQLRSVSDGIADAREMPTELIRFITSDANGLDVAFGHADADWKWPEHTLVLFFRKEDGSPNDMLQALQQQTQRSDLHPLVRGIIESARIE